MTIDELRDAATPMLQQIDFDAIDGSQQMLFLVEHDGAPVFRVWAIDAAAAHIANIPRCAELLTRPQPANLLCRVVTLTLGEFEVADLLIEDRPQPRTVH